MSRLFLPTLLLACVGALPAMAQTAGPRRAAPESAQDGRRLREHRIERLERRGERLERRGERLQRRLERCKKCTRADQQRQGPGESPREALRRRLAQRRQAR